MSHKLLIRNKKENRIQKEQILQPLIILLLLILSMVCVFYEKNKVYAECYVEAGIEVFPQDFFKETVEGVEFAENSDVIDITKPGKYDIVLKTKYFTYKSILNIEDSIAPIGQAVKVNAEIGEKFEAKDFVTNIEDVTNVKIEYVEKPDFSKAGSQAVNVVLTDLGGNQSIIESELFVSLVVEELIVEAGGDIPKLEDFVIEGETSEFITNIEKINYSIPDNKIVKLKVDGIVYDVNMRIVDTVPPKIQLQEINGYTLLPRKPEEFVTTIEDVTNVTINYRKELDVNIAGEQIVEIVAIDEGGNETVGQTKLLLQEDTEAPVIKGVRDINIIIGKPISYKKNITVTDNCTEGLEFFVDNSKVDLKSEGTYPITYIARDYAGNETCIPANVIIKPRVYTESEVYSFADNALAAIITPNMTQFDKVQAIYNYIRGHMSYISSSEKVNWIKSAYEGFVDGKGDCYVYASMAKVLLTRAGITNMDIVKIPASTNHYWNLVNLGEGWYHYDTTPRKDGPRIFMWTEAQLMEYSNKHKGSHNYDHSLYPVVN